MVRHAAIGLEAIAEQSVSTLIAGRNSRLDGIDDDRLFGELELPRWSFLQAGPNRNSLYTRVTHISTAK
jgi:hypothetical protein